MPLTRTKSSSTVRRGRPAGPSCRGGASSLLRLAQPESKRLPGTLDLAEWAKPRGRRADAGGPACTTVFAASEFGSGVGR